jgi:hypothetical protein
MGRRVMRLGLAAGAISGLLVLCYDPLRFWVQAAVSDPIYEPSRFFLEPTISLKIAGLGLLWFLLARIAIRMMGQVVARPRGPLSLILDQNGHLVLEFALVFPFILSLIFILFQWTELLMVEALVHYAAFSACRTACSYASSIQPGGAGRPSARFQLEQTKEALMQRAAQLAMSGAKPLEAGVSKHFQAQISFLGSAPNSPPRPAPVQIRTDIRPPTNGLGGYIYIHLKVRWGFFPRWPMAQLFFWPLVQSGGGRILVDVPYEMQTDGYYRSPSTNGRSPAAVGGERYESRTNMMQPTRREGIAQRALYYTVLPEAHGAVNPIAGTRDSLARRCP